MFARFVRGINEVGDGVWVCLPLALPVLPPSPVFSMILRAIPREVW